MTRIEQYCTFTIGGLHLGVPVQGALPEALVARAALELDHHPASPTNLADMSATE